MLVLMLLLLLLSLIGCWLLIVVVIIHLFLPKETVTMTWSPIFAPNAGLYRAQGYTTLRMYVLV